MVIMTSCDRILKDLSLGLRVSLLLLYFSEGWLRSSFATLLVSSMKFSSCLLVLVLAEVESTLEFFTSSMSHLARAPTDHRTCPTMHGFLY